MKSRRKFLGTAAAGMAASRLRLNAGETLAIAGGSKAVTFPAQKVSALTKWPRYGGEEKAALSALLDNNQWYAEIPAFEKELKEHLGVPFAKAHMNGTSALMSMFWAVDLPPGSEILAPSYTAWATTAPMHLFGYVPAFVDINPRTMTFDLAYAKKRLNGRTKALIVMHSFGNPCDMDAAENGIEVLGLGVAVDVVAGAERFGIEPDRRQRRFQLVRHAGDKLGAHGCQAGVALYRSPEEIRGEARKHQDDGGGRRQDSAARSARFTGGGGQDDAQTGEVRAEAIAFVADDASPEAGQHWHRPYRNG